MDTQLFELFAGRPDRDPLWLETIRGREEAQTKLQRHATAKPGPYFIFSTATYNVVAKIDTTPRAAAGGR
jgi:hypothetical protein